MDDQKDIDSINRRLYNIEVPNEPIKKVMFYFTVLHDVIDYKFPPNYLNFENPYFKNYSEMEAFLAVAKAFNPEFLHVNNVLIYYNKKDFYDYYHVKHDDNGNPYEFKIIDPKDSSDPEFHQNYENSFNIPNINYHEKEFDVEIPNKVEFPHSESSDTVEDYYYTEGLEPNYEDQEDNHYEYVGDKADKKQYLRFRKKYNEKIIKNKNKTTLQSSIYPNQMGQSENTTGSPEEEESNEQETTDTTVNVVNIINKLVVTEDWINYIYNEPVKQLLFNLKKAVKEEDVIRVKTISLPKNVFFYLSILVLLLILACSIALIYYCAVLHENKKFNDMNKDPPNPSSRLFISKSDDDTIIYCKKCHHRVRIGLILGMTSGALGIFFVLFIIVLWIALSVAPKKKKKNAKTNEKAKASPGLNIVHIFVLSLIHIISFIIAIVAEIFIIIGLATKNYDFVHHSSRNQLILNSIILVGYILIIIFYFKQ